MNKIKLSKAITLIKLTRFKEAIDIFSSIQPKYKEAKQYKSATICIILLSQCALSEGDKSKFRQFYNGAKQIVKLHKINFGGIEIADSEYRIGQYLLKQNPKDQHALDVNFRHAFQQYGELMYTRQLLEKMKGNWDKYQEMGIQEPILIPIKKPNKYIYLTRKLIQLDTHI